MRYMTLLALVLTLSLNVPAHASFKTIAMKAIGLPLAAAVGVGTAVAIGAIGCIYLPVCYMHTVWVLTADDPKPAVKQ